MPTLARLIAFCLLFFIPVAMAAGPLRVGMTIDYPPLHYKQDDNIVGVEADNALAVGRILGRRIILVELDFDALIPALEAGDIDVIMSGFSITAQRSARVAFTAPYMKVGQMAIVHRDKIASFGQPWALYREGVRIGVEPGTTGAAYAERELKDASISYFADADQAFAGLRTDRIDLYIHDAPTSWRLANSNEYDDLISLYRPLTDEMLAWAVRQDDLKLQQDLNTALLQMKNNGTLNYILNRWIPVQVEVN